VDLVAVDAHVVDRNGRPVDNLRPDEFRIEVDGKPRRVVSAEFVAFRSDPAPSPGRAFSTNVGQPPGRLIMLVIDEGNIRVGSVKTVVNGAMAFIDQLGPSDRVALQMIPGAGPLVNFTADHALVKRTLQTAAGRVIEADRTDRVGVAEAFRIIAEDAPPGVPPIQSTLAAVIERECPGDHDATSIQRCRGEMENLARRVYAEARSRAMATTVALREIVERLTATTDPKTLVLITSGMIVEHYADISWIADRTAAASLGFYALRLDQAQFDATMARRSPTRAADRDQMVEGLDQVVGLARGTVWGFGNDPTVTFDRLRLEMSGHYLLSFAPEGDDRNGREHRITIGVTRPGLRVTGRRAFRLDAVAAPPVIDEELAEVIRAPLVYSDFGVRATTYSFRDAGTGRVKVLVSAEVDEAAGTAAEIGIAYAVTGENGRIVAADVERPDAAATGRGRRFTGSFVVDPGPYDVKVAAVGAGGRRGSVEHPFHAGVQTFGQLRLGDLLIASPAADAGVVRPTVDGRIEGRTIVGYTEVYSEAEAQFDTVAMRLEVARAADGPALATVAMRLVPASERGRRAAEGSLPLVLVPEGEYVVRAVMDVNGREALRASRPVTIGPPAAATSGGASSPAAPLSIVPLESTPERFDRAAVLSRPVVGFFVNKLSGPGLPAMPESLAPAVGLTRTLRLADARTIALQSAPEHFASRFIAGLADFAEGNLQGAAVHFSGTLTAAPAFTPAAFYLGAALAASDRDADAVTAWQSAFLVDPQAPWQHTLMADALLRQQQTARALAVLQEAAGLWPDHDPVLMRIAVAHAQNGTDREAMKLLVPYLERHPEDLARHLLGMRLLHTARAAGRALETVEIDRQRFLAWFAIYERGKGPELEAAREWRRAFGV
jgi:VWFA-related protein